MGLDVNHKISKLAAGLYFVATPIGTARDITLRALDILASADVIAAEDTRSMRKLMDIHGIPLNGRPMLAYHDHNGDKVRPKLMQYMAEGKSVAYGSEAGTPMIADPGYHLAKQVAETGHLVTSAPGPVAFITALTLSGLPSDRILFEGFLPNTKSQRCSKFAELSEIPATLVFYESPKRIAATLNDAIATLGGARNAAIARELTKKFEEVRRGTLNDLRDSVAAQPPKGEIVLLIDRARSSPVNQDDIDDQIRNALDKMSVKDAADMVSAATGQPKRKIYQRALAIDKSDDR
jgi:16S rRNA (cytidine1402-2'-O)-methyltransferase